MGNGNLGAMVWGDSTLNITVNRADFWDHRGGELVNGEDVYRKIVEETKNGFGVNLNDVFEKDEFPEDVFKPQRIPVGRFEFHLKDNDRLEKITLSYLTGEVAAKTVSGKILSLHLDLNSNILLIKDNGNIIDEVEIKPSWDFEQSREWLSKYGFEAPERIEEEKIAGWIQPCPDDPSLAVACSKGEEQYAISLELGDDNNKAYDAVIKNIERSCADKFIKNNKKWWAEFWESAPVLNLPDEFFNKFYKYTLYRFASATHPASPLPSGLQGPWIEEYHRSQWSGDYHFNVNIQQIYTLAFSTGKLEHLLPFFDMVESESFWNNMRHNAKAMFGIEDGLLLTHAVDDKGFQCGWISAGSTLDQACAAWVAQLYWLYYKYSHDVTFLEKRAYPFMLGVMRVYEEMLEEHEGRLSIPVAISAEYGCRNPGGAKAGRDPSYQLACIHMLLDALNEACQKIGEKPRDIWADMKKRVPYFSVVEGLDPYFNKEKRIGIWENQDLDVCHRHHSHLGCIYPFDSLPNELDEEIKEIIDNSIDQWILMGMGQWSEWCIPWAAILQTRLGFSESPLVLLGLFKEIFINEGFASVYLPRFRGIIAHRRHDMNKPKETHEVMQLEGVMGAATALLEMCAHVHSGVLNVFAGIPEKWKNVSFENIYLPDRFIVSGCRQPGALDKVRIKSLSGGDIKLKINGQIKVLSFEHGEEKEVTGNCKHF
jgi:hypothetical protein